MEILRRFNDDKATKEALKEYLVGYFKDAIIERALRKQSVESLADAITELEKGFEQLAIDYELPKQNNEQVNPAR